MAIRTSDEGMIANMVEFPSAGDQIRGYLAWPQAPGRHPAVVVIMEIWGLNEHIQDVARRFAKEGHVALAVDLYSREKVVADYGDLQKMRAFVAEIPDDRVVQDLEAGVRFLKDHPFVRPDRIGSVGFCMGGFYSLMLARHSRELAAAITFYGRLIYEATNAKKPRSPIESAVSISCPFLGLFGEEDASIPLPHVEQLKASLAKHGKTFEVISYPGAPHAFFNDERPSYRAEASADAWRRTLAFFGQHLKG